MKKHMTRILALAAVAAIAIPSISYAAGGRGSAPTHKRIYKHERTMEHNYKTRKYNRHERYERNRERQREHMEMKERMRDHNRMQWRTEKDQFGYND